ncbi:MAG: hypothetical protein GQ565_08620 [Candidatus Aegiribacteria sp.]|nr:hypothetical protein [Candidatus Aegiribacteria sp.]
MVTLIVSRSSAHYLDFPIYNDYPLRTQDFNDLTSTGFENVIYDSETGHYSIPLPDGFEPTGSFWGSFWNDSDAKRFPESGFVLYDDSGQYVTVYQTGPISSSKPFTEPWVCSAEKSGLFPSGLNLPDDEELIFVSRLNMSSNGGPFEPFVAGRDFLCAVTNSGYNKTLHWLGGCPRMQHRHKEPHIWL